MFCVVHRPGVDDTDWVLDNALGKNCKVTSQCVVFFRPLCDVRCACQLPLAVCTVREGLMHLVLSLHLGKCLLAEAFRCVTHGCEFYETPIGVGRKALHPQVQRLLQRRPRVLRRKRDCTPPSSSHSRGGLLPRPRGLRRRKDWHLSLPPHTAGKYFVGGGTGPPPHNVRESLGGGRSVLHASGQG